MPPLSGPPHPFFLSHQLPHASQGIRKVIFLSSSLSSNSNHPVSFLPEVASLSSLSSIPSGSLNLQDFSHPLPLSQLPTPGDTPWKPAGPRWPWKQVGNLHSLSSPPIPPSVLPTALQQTTCCGLSFLCPHSQASTQILEAHSIFLSPGDSLSPLSPFLIVSSQHLETQSIPEPPRPPLAGSRKQSLPGNSQTPHSPKNQRGQQKNKE